MFIDPCHDLRHAPHGFLRWSWPGRHVPGRRFRAYGHVRPLSAPVTLAGPQRAVGCLWLLAILQADIESSPKLGPR